MLAIKRYIAKKKHKPHLCVPNVLKKQAIERTKKVVVQEIEVFSLGQLKLNHIIIHIFFLEKYISDKYGFVV